MILSPVLHVASRQWMLGIIENHTARPLTLDEIDQHIKEFLTLQEQVKLLESTYRDVRIQHSELIMAVACKFPGETRHQTALRYIQERESAPSESASVPATEPTTTTERSESGTTDTQPRTSAASPGPTADAGESPIAGQT